MQPAASFVLFAAVCQPCYLAVPSTTFPRHKYGAAQSWAPSYGRSVQETALARTACANSTTTRTPVFPLAAATRNEWPLAAATQQRVAPIHDDAPMMMHVTRACVVLRSLLHML